MTFLNTGPTVFIIANSASGRVLTVTGNVDGAVIEQQHPSYVGYGQITKAPIQSWELVPVGQNTGIFKIVSVWLGKVLDVRGSSTEAGALIQLYDDHGGANQHWRLELMGDVDSNIPGWAFTIISERSGKVLAVPLDKIEDDGAFIQQDTFNGGQNQLWFLQVVS